MDKLPKVSICFCVYNEEENVLRCLEDARQFLGNLGFLNDSELIVVDNASSDSTRSAALSWMKNNFPQGRVITHESNRLYSGSVTTCLKEADGEYVFILDGDYEHRSEDVRHFIDLMSKSDIDVVFGWKKDRKDVFMRLVFSWGLRLVSRHLIGHRLHDINCGFRGLKRKAAKQISISEKVNSVGPELYCECLRLDLNCSELPVQHFARDSGEGLHDNLIPLLKNTFKFLKYLLRLKKRYNLGALKKRCKVWAS